MRFDDIQAFDDGGMVDNSSPMQFDDIQPEEAPNAPAQFADIQASGQPQPAQAGPEPPQTGPIGAAIAGAAPAAAPITAAIAAGARTMAAIPNPWIGVPAGLVAGLIASGVVGKIQDWLRDQYGPSTGPLSKPYEAAAEQQQPLAYNIGRVAPIAAGMTTGNVTPLVRAASAGLMGGVDVLQQGIEKGFSNINPTEALIQAGAGAIMPQAREWAGGPRTSAGTGETPVGKPATQDALAEQQIQGTKSAPFNISNAEGTSATQSPPTNSRRAPVAEATVEDQGTGFSMVASSRDELKPGVGPGRPGEGVEGAPSTVVDTAPIPADVAAATAQAPAETPAPAQAQSTPPAPAPQPPPNPASALPRGPQPVPQAAELAPQSQLGQPSTTPIPGALNPDEGLLQASRAQREAIANIKAKNAQQQTGEAFKPEEDTSTGLEGQVPNAQKVINDAMVAALQRPIVRQPMPSIANSSKDITGPVVIDPTVPPEFDKPLAVHETVEGELEKLGMKYPQSHQIATMAEKTAAEHAGMDWGQYTKWFAQNSAQIEAQKIMPDTWDHLDLASDPYTDIGHHTNKEIAEDTEQALKSPDLSTPEAARPPSDFTGKLDPNISASDYTQRLAALRADRPRPINKLWNNPDTAPPDRVAAQQAKIKAWNSEYATVSRNQKQALDRDNANFYAKQAVGQEQVSTPGAEIAPPSGNVPDLNEIPDFLRRQPPAAQEAIAKSIGTEPTIEGTPHSLGAAALNDATSNMEKANGQGPPPDGAQKAIDASTPNRVPFRTRRAAETWLNKTWAGKILSPTTMDETGQAAAADIRERRGAIRRTQDAFDHALGKPMEDLIGALPLEQQREIQIAMQEANPMERLKSMPELEPAIRAMRMTLKKDETFIRANGKLDPDQFQQWYFPQMWKNEEQGTQFLDSWIARQGSGAGLKTKKWPDIPTGLANGLELKHDNPIEAMRERRNGVYQYLMMNNLLEHGIDTGMVTAERTADNVPLAGRGLGDRQLYAPEGYATVFNNAYSPGWRGTPAGKQFMDLAQPTTNWGTGVLLGMSAFHPFTMLNEGFINQVALAMQQGTRDPALALKNLITSPAGAYTLYRKGLDVAKEWNDRGAVPELTKIVDRLEDANGRAIGHSDPTYRFLPEGWKSITKEWKGVADDLQASFANATTPGETAGAAGMVPLIVGKATLRTVGAIMDTAAKPLFGHVIPMMKNGAFRQNLGEWLVQHPNAEEPEQIQAATKIWDDIENRFGLMTHDNIFWDNKLKEGLQLGLTSYSWQMGFGRNVGGGAAQWALHPSRFSMSSPDYDPRLGSTLALAMTVAAMSGAYQYLKTGEPPKDVNDLLAGRTGGKTTGGQPERAILPGFQKDVYGWLHDPLGEAQNKLGVVPRTALEMVSNKGWARTSKGSRYGMISNPAHSIPQQIEERTTHAAKNFIPIIGQQIMGRDVNPASNITTGERAAAIRPAPKYINPGGNIAEDKYVQKEWKITHPEETQPRIKGKLTQPR